MSGDFILKAEAAAMIKAYGAPPVGFSVNMELLNQYLLNLLPAVPDSLNIFLGRDKSELTLVLAFVKDGVTHYYRLKGQDYVIEHVRPIDVTASTLLQ